MAESVTYVCGGCGKRVGAWSDGNPYYLDESGAKRYAYHPNHEALDRCIGNDTEHLCLSCGAEFKVDSRSPVAKCPGCGSAETARTYKLEGRRCPYCKAGVFAVDPNDRCIS